VKRVRLDGEVLSVQQAATRLGIAVGTVKQRIKAGKLDSFDDAMGNVNQKTVMVAGEAMSMRAAARKLGVSIATVQRRVEKGQALEAKAESVDSDLFISAVISYEQDVRAQIAVGLAVERGEPLSLREVGEIMEISHESVRQIEERYLEQLGDELARMGLEEEIVDELRLRDSMRRETHWDRAQAIAPGKINIKATGPRAPDFRPRRNGVLIRKDAKRYMVGDEYLTLGELASRHGLSRPGIAWRLAMGIPLEQPSRRKADVQGAESTCGKQTAGKVGRAA
jgi:predicted DNA-binding protein (UPF0251 family)